MSATRDQALVAGSKIAVSASPSSPVVNLPSPPAVMTRPSGSVALPAQKMLPGALSVVGNVCVAEFHTNVGCGPCQPSKARTLPFLSRIAWTATSGQFISVDHWPAGLPLGVTAFEACGGEPVPTAFVALTANV